MALEIWLMVIILIVGAAIIFSFVRKFFKALGLIMLLFIVINLAFSFLVIRDFMDIKNTWFSEPRLYALNSGGEIKAAVSFTFPQRGQQPDFKLAKSEELIRYTQFLKDDDLSAIQGDNRCLFMINDIFAENIAPVSLDFGGTNISKEESLDMLMSDKSFELFTNKTLGSDMARAGILYLDNQTKQNMLSQLGLEEEGQFKSLMFMMVVVQGMFSGGPSGLIDSIDQYKKGNMVVYPETLFFRSFKIFPTSLLRAVSSRLTEKAGGAVETVSKKAGEQGT